MQKRVAFHTLGCKLNQVETSVIKNKLRQKGYTEVELGQEAELIVINTCTVTETADTECRQIIRRGLKGAPTASVAVAGCYSQLQPEKVASIEGVKAVFGNINKTHIANIADEMSQWTSPKVFVNDMATATGFEGAATQVFGERSRAYLKLQDGCEYSCTYCTIPAARGPARAMEMQAIAYECMRLADQGFHEVILTDINLGEYRSSNGHRFIDVLTMMDGLSLPYRVRISSIEPNTLSREIIDLVASSDLFAPHFHVPLQSGSSDILKSMKRRYNPEMYRRTMESIRATKSDAAIGIDVIVGYPGETDALFDESVAFIQSMPFTYLHVFTYSERSGTPAALLPGRVSEAIRKERTRLLRSMSKEREREFWTKQLGTVRTAISDQYDRSNDLLRGYTENYIPVRFTGRPALHRTPVKVRLTDVGQSWVNAELV